ncbi:MAG: DUF4292 domain-containing protein [Prolixibacteraceae bacterium]|nr:DUF4292 domain-containing protein [Prolixibacteraceae bacterium]
MKIKAILCCCLWMLIILVSGCKHTEKIVIEKKIRPVGIKRLVRTVTGNELKYNTLSVKKVSLTLDNNGKVNSVRGFYRIKRDSIIQVSAQTLIIPVGKLELSTDSFRVVNHLGKQVMKGTIQKIADTIGYDIDFQIVQSILSNHMQSMRQDLKENKFKEYVLVVENNMYKISSIRERKFRKFAANEEKLERFKQRKDEQHLVKQDIFVDPDIFVVRKEIYHDIDTDRVITIEFSEFKAIGTKWFPGKIHLSVSGKEKLDVQVELSKVSIDDENDFGFSIPSKYKQEELKLK